MDNDKLFSYLSNEEKHRISEKVYEEELRKAFQEDVKLRDPSIFHNDRTVYSRILSEYIKEMNLKHEEFIPGFKIILKKEIEDIVNSEGINSDNELAQHIRFCIQKLATNVIAESEEELKPIIRDKVFKCCNETLLIAFLSDIVRRMNLDAAVKKIISEYEDS